MLNSPPATIEIATEPTPALVAAVSHLLPQLSSAVPPDRDRLSGLIDHQAVDLLVAYTADREIVGLLSLVTFPIPSGTRAWIEDVVVDERSRGKGIASLLIHRACSIADEKGARSIDLTSRPSREEANRLYQRLGFVQRETNVYRRGK